RLGGVDVAVGAELGDAVEGGGLAEVRVEATVYHLEHLDGELDVPDPSGSPLQVPGGGLLLSPRLDEPDRPQLLGLQAPLPDELPGHVDEPLAQAGVAGRSPDLEQRLQLPTLRPAVVIGPVTGEAAAQRADGALGAEAGVDDEGRAFEG